MLHIVTDGASDLPAAWLDEYQIHVLPINIQFGNRTYLQNVDLDINGFYRLIEETGLIPRTSQPSPHQFMDFYQKIAQPGDTILSVHVGGKLSGTMDSARIAAQNLADRFQIVPFDSMAGSAAVGWMCRHARLLARRGASLDTILATLKQTREQLLVILALDTLEFARLSGRVNRIQTTLASLLKIKPIVLLENGMLNIVGKVRTRAASLQHIQNLAAEKIAARPMHLSIVHARAPQEAARLLAAARQRFNVAMSNILDLSISVTVHLGPGTIGMVFYPAETF